MNQLEATLNLAVTLHGKLCPGIVIGVKMAVLGLKKIEISDPLGKQRKDHLAFIENSNCAVDAIQCITGCKVSNGALKVFDYGKMAASFFNLKTKNAVRIICPSSVKNLVDRYCTNLSLNKQEREIYAYKIMPENEMFTVKKINIFPSFYQHLGKKRELLVCPSCEESIPKEKAVFVEGKLLCTPCAGSSYYTLL